MWRHNVQDDWEIERDRGQCRDKKKRERKWQRERSQLVAPWLFPDRAAVAVIFPSGGNKVTLARVRTGDRRSGRLRRSGRPLLTTASVSKGDRSEELLTGGPWHHTAPAPGDAESAHHSTGSRNGKTGRVRSYLLPSSHCSLTWVCYFTNLHVEDGQRHKTLIWPSVSHIAFCFKEWRSVSARELSSMVFGDTWG